MILSRRLQRFYWFGEENKKTRRVEKECKGRDLNEKQDITNPCFNPDICTFTNKLEASITKTTPKTTNTKQVVRLLKNTEGVHERGSGFKPSKLTFLIYVTLTSKSLTEL